jgi:hypothetical protein
MNIITEYSINNFADLSFFFFLNQTKHFIQETKKNKNHIVEGQSKSLGWLW